MGSTVTQILGYFATIFDSWQRVNMIQRFLFFYKEIYKWQLVNSLPVNPYGFIPPAKIPFPPRGLYRPLLKPKFAKTQMVAKLLQFMTSVCSMAIDST